ncbi:hypothetical protein [Sphaerisporangium perillae]|uniref:hypothetical protein n=1 Tax=Sphaerisporangium perillae TaxID=2935860 RepID=UPI00200D358E|nr:hypothetical protein [Sphaerisporangium perillae]
MTAAASRPCRRRSPPPRGTLEATCDTIIAALPRQDDDVALLLTRTAPALP